MLVRADLNVPLDGGAVADDTRIRAALPTLELLLERRAAIVLVSHLGRPEGRDPALSMAPVRDRLAELLGVPVELAPGVVGDDVRTLAEATPPGSVLLLENSRFEPGETKNDPALAAGLAELADLYVNDAFGAAHRAHATTEGVARLLPAYAGLLLEREVEELTRVRDDPERPLVVVLGRRQGHRQDRGPRALPRDRRRGPDRRRDVLRVLPRPGDRDRRLAGGGRGDRDGEGPAREPARA